MLFAEAAVLVHLKSVRIVLLVLHGVVVALLAFCTRQCNFNSHFRHLLFSCPFSGIIASLGRGIAVLNGGSTVSIKRHKKISPIRGIIIIPHIFPLVKGFFHFFIAVDKSLGMLYYCNKELIKNGTNRHRL